MHEIKFIHKLKYTARENNKKIFKKIYELREKLIQ